MHSSDWLEICSHISVMWPNDPVPPDTAASWFPLVADLDADAVTVAVRQLRLDQAQRFAPTPATLRAAMADPAPSWAEAVPEIVRRLSSSTRLAPDGTEDTVAAYIATLGPLRGLKWDPADPATRAQLRDWWRDHHAARDRAERAQVAVAARQLDGIVGGPAAATLEVRGG